MSHSLPISDRLQSQIQAALDSHEHQQPQVPSESSVTTITPSGTLPSISGSPMSPNTPGSRKPIFDLSGAPLAVPETFTDSSEVQLNAKRLLPSFTYVGSLSSYPYFDLRVSNILC